MLLLSLGTPLCDYQPGRKNKLRLKIILQCRTSLLTRTYPIKNHKWRPDRTHSCIPRVSSRTRRLGTKSATALLATPLYPPAHAVTRDGAGLACGAVLGVHARTRNERRKKEESTESANRKENTKTRRKGPASSERRRFRSGSSEKPGMYQPSTLRE